MERLTIRSENPKSSMVWFKEGDYKFEPFEMDSHRTRLTLQALASYEDLDLTPEQIREVDRLYAEKCREVAELQRQLENSVKLPCAYNDTMYWIVRGHIREVWFKGIRCGKGYKQQIAGNRNSAEVG